MRWRQKVFLQRNWRNCYIAERFDPKVQSAKGMLKFPEQNTEERSAFRALFFEFGLSRLTTGFLDIVGGGGDELWIRPVQHK